MFTLRPETSTIILLLFAIVILPGCGSSTQVLHPTPDASVKTIYQHGEQILLSNKESSTLALMNEVQRGEMRLFLAVQNFGQEAVTVAPKDVKGFTVMTHSGERLLETFSAEDVLDRVRDRQRRERLAMAFSHALQAAESSYDSDVAQEIDESQRKRDASQFNRNQANEYARAVNRVFQRHTIMPGRTYAGQVIIKGPSIAADWNVEGYILRVHVGSETHEIPFQTPKN
jgi:hypothetical protein